MHLIKKNKINNDWSLTFNQIFLKQYCFQILVGVHEVNVPQNLHFRKSSSSSTSLKYTQAVTDMWIMIHMWIMIEAGSVNYLLTSIPFYLTSRAIIAPDLLVTDVSKVFFCLCTLIVGLLMLEELPLFKKKKTLLTNGLKLNCCECCIKSELSLWSNASQWRQELSASGWNSFQLQPAFMSIFVNRGYCTNVACAVQWSFLKALILRRTFCTFDWLFCQSIPSRGILRHGQGYSVVLNTDGGGVSSRAPHTESGWISLDIHL